MNQAILGLATLALVLAARGAAADLRDQAKAKLPPSTYEFFAGEIKDKYPRDIKAYAIAEARVSRTTIEAYCPKRGAECGPSPTCKHSKVSVQALDLRLERVLFTTAPFSWPEEYLRYPAYEQGRFREGDRLQVSLYGYRTDSSGISKLRKLAGPAPADTKPK